MNTHDKLNGDFEQAVTQLKQQTPSEQQFQAMQENLDLVIAQESKRQAAVDSRDQSESFLSKLSHFVRFPKVLASSAATFAIAVVSMILVSTSSGPAFAKVVEQLNSLNSMSYSSQLFSQGKKLMTLKVFYQSPGQVRVETYQGATGADQPSMVNILNTALGKGLILLPANQQAVPFDFANQNNKAAVQPITENPLQWFELLKEFKGEAEVLEPKLIKGNYAQGYEITESGMKITIWADVDTNIPVQFSLESNVGESLFEMEADISINPLLSKDLFSLQTPGHYQNQSED